MTTYATFTEHNDSEGETWRFHIPIAGNEKALSQLRAIVDQTDEAYHLDLVPVDEAAVDARVALGDGDYMAAHNKLSGRLALPDDVAKAITEDDLLYKGGVEDLMEAGEE